MPIEDRIVWALYRLFENKPTSISKMSEVLGLDSKSIQYYLRKGTGNKDLERCERGKYISTNEGITRIRDELNRDPDMFVVHPKDGSYWTKDRFYIKYGDKKEGNIEND